MRTSDCSALLCCPACAAAGRIAFDPDDLHPRAARCGACGAVLAVRDGVPDFAPGIPLQDPALPPPQRVMNTRQFARLYETPLWRPLHTWIGSGMSWTEEVRRVLEMAAGGTVATVADLACGTGHYARAFGRRLPEATVYALDISPGMLAQGRVISEREGVRNVRFLRGDIHRLPFPDGSLDLVNCGGALHLFADTPRIWREIHRVLRRGGRFTAMTIPARTGLAGRVQQRLMRRGAATFFVPERLQEDLRQAGFHRFVHAVRRFSLLFAADKE